MTQPRLLTCPACSRHVRMSESACPFCKASLTEAVQAFVPRQPPKERLSRGALYAFGVGTLAVAAACGGVVAGGGGDGSGGGTSQEGSHTFADADGGVPPDSTFHSDDGGTDGANDAFEYGDIGAIDAYGASPPDGEYDANYGDDANNDADFTADAGYGIAVDAYYPDDASEPADAGVGVPYGLPPH